MACAKTLPADDYRRLVELQRHEWWSTCLKRYSKYTSSGIREDLQAVLPGSRWLLPITEAIMKSESSFPRVVQGWTVFNEEEARRVEERYQKDQEDTEAAYRAHPGLEEFMAARRITCELISKQRMQRFEAELRRERLPIWKTSASRSQPDISNDQKSSSEMGLKEAGHPTKRLKASVPVLNVKARHWEEGIVALKSDHEESPEPMIIEEPTCPTISELRRRLQEQMEQNQPVQRVFSPEKPKSLVKSAVRSREYREHLKFYDLDKYEALIEKEKVRRKAVRDAKKDTRTDSEVRDAIQAKELRKAVNKEIRKKTEAARQKANRDRAKSKNASTRTPQE